MFIFMFLCFFSLFLTRLKFSGKRTYNSSNTSQRGEGVWRGRLVQASVLCTTNTNGYTLQNT